MKRYIPTILFLFFASIAQADFFSTKSQIKEQYGPGCEAQGHSRGSNDYINCIQKSYMQDDKPLEKTQTAPTQSEAVQSEAAQETMLEPQTQTMNPKDVYGPECEKSGHRRGSNDYTNCIQKSYMADDKPLPMAPQAPHKPSLKEIYDAKCKEEGYRPGSNLYTQCLQDNFLKN